MGRKLDKFVYQGQEVYFCAFSDCAESFPVKVVPVKWFEENITEDHIDWEGAIDISQLDEELRDQFEDFPSLNNVTFYRV